MYKIVANINLTTKSFYDTIVVPEELSLSGVQLRCEREFKRNVITSL